MNNGDLVINKISGEFFLIIGSEFPNFSGKTHYLRNESTGRSGYFDINEFEPLPSLTKELF
jgi:hypothetical protein